MSVTAPVSREDSAAGTHAFKNSDRREISFGPFRLIPAERLLLEDGTATRIGSRALDILIALLERPGELIGKHELVARVWPNTVVADSNLKVHVAGLRRVIGDGIGDRRYIVSVPGRGYCFVAPVTYESIQVKPAEMVPMRQKHGLPLLQTRLVGRAAAITMIAQKNARSRLRTIVGPGGIGKSSVALAAAQQMAHGYKDGVWLVDLGSVSDDRFVSASLAAALGLERPSSDIIGALRAKRMLIVLDGCTHVLRGARQLATALLDGAPHVEILATSRAPLGIPDERVYQLAPLDIPPASTRLSAAEALHFPAIQLLVELAAASIGDFELRDEDASAAAEICRRLDGLPLAIELAATRVGTFGLRALVPHLDNPLGFLIHTQRRVLARHQSMRATLDWSHRLLGDTEQRVMRRVAIFPGSFTAQAGGAICVDTDVTQRDTQDALSELVRQSLITVEVPCGEPRYQLLNLIRAYAREKLIESGEFAITARRHAEHCTEDQ